MKKYVFSFLFLFFVKGHFLLAFPKQETSQKNSDSIQYYSRKITAFENDDSVLEALDFFFNKNNIALQNGDALKVAYFKSMIAMGQFNMSQLWDSEKSAVVALKILEEQKVEASSYEEILLLSMYNHLGAVYRKLKDYDNAVYYYNKALRLKGSQQYKISIINNISNIYKDEKKYHKAIELLNTIYTEILHLKNNKEKATALGNLGYSQAKLNIADGIINMELALKLQIQENNLSGQFSSYSNLSSYYKDTKNLSKARMFATKALRIADTLESREYQEKALKGLLDLGDTTIVNRYVSLIDVINNQKLLQENKYASMQYDVNKEKVKTQNAELQQEKEKRFKQAFQFVGAFVVLVAIFIILYLRSKHKRENVVQIYQTETRISKKVHDEVANDIYFVMNKLQNATSNTEDVLDDLEEIYLKTRDISRENSDINTKDNFAETLKFLLLNYKTDETNIITKGINTIAWKSISENKKTALYRVLQELMTNMRKHSNATIVAITFDQINNKTVINYKDNGLGTSVIKANGLLNAENRIETVNGTISFESEANNGFKSIIKL